MTHRFDKKLEVAEKIAMIADIYAHNPVVGPAAELCALRVLSMGEVQITAGETVITPEMVPEVAHLKQHLRDLVHHLTIQGFLFGYTVIHFDLFTFEGFKNALLLPTVVPMGTYHLMRFDSPNAHVLRGRTSRHVLETHGAVFFDSHAAARYDNSLFGYPVAITLVPPDDFGGPMSKVLSITLLHQCMRDFLIKHHEVNEYNSEMHAYYTLQNAKAHPSVLGQDIMRPTAADISMGVSQADLDHRNAQAVRMSVMSQANVQAYQQQMEELQAARRNARLDPTDTIPVEDGVPGLVGRLRHQAPGLLHLAPLNSTVEHCPWMPQVHGFDVVLEELERLTAIQLNIPPEKLGITRRGALGAATDVIAQQTWDDHTHNLIDQADKAMLVISQIREDYLERNHRTLLRRAQKQLARGTIDKRQFNAIKSISTTTFRYFKRKTHLSLQRTGSFLKPEALLRTVASVYELSLNDLDPDAVLLYYRAQHPAVVAGLSVLAGKGGALKPAPTKEEDTTEDGRGGGSDDDGTDTGAAVRLLLKSVTAPT